MRYFFGVNPIGWQIDGDEKSKLFEIAIWDYIQSLEG